MRKLIVSTLMSLDGVFESPNSWAGAYFDQDAASRSLARLQEADAMLMGRKTYEYFAPMWSAVSGPYADRINAMRKYVFSSSLPSVEWTNSVLIRDDVVESVTDLKSQEGRDLVVYGSGQLTQTLLEHDLVDLLDVWVHPVIVGSGAAQFRPTYSKGLRFLSAEPRPNGVASLKYASL